MSGPSVNWFLLLFTVLKSKNRCIFQSEAENLRKERDMLKMVEIRLTQEKESVQAQQHGQSLLLTNLKSIQVMSASSNVLTILRR